MTLSFIGSKRDFVKHESFEVITFECPSCGNNKAYNHGDLYFCADCAAVYIGEI